MASDNAIFTDKEDEDAFMLPKYRMLAVDPINEDNTASRFIVVCIEYGWETEADYNNWLQDRDYNTGRLGDIGKVRRLNFDDAVYVLE